MPSIRLPESISKLVKTSNTMLSFPSSIVNIGAKQYKNTSALTLNTATIGLGGVDASLTASSTYYVYAVVSNGVMAIIGSKNSSLPSGFTIAKQIGLFNTNGSSLIGYPDVPVSTSIPGQIISFGGDLPPVGWLICDGSAVSRSIYSALYSAIGIAWGYGDNSTTFNLPDLRGRFPRGTDAGIARDPDRASRTVCNTGGNTGDNIGSVQGHQYYSHGHGGITVGMTGTTTGGGFFTNDGGDYPTFDGMLLAPLRNQNIAWVKSLSNSGVGGSGGNESRPLNANVHYIIKF
jgi:microcystin-dependent protein